MIKDYLRKYGSIALYNTWKQSNRYIEPHIADIKDGNTIIGLEFKISKAAGSVSTAPVANSLTYDGTAQTVASAGTGTGTMMYRLGDSGDYSSTIPTATNAGSYTLYYYAAESVNYSATTPASISITISKAAGSVSTAPVANSLTYDGTAQTVASAGTGTGTMMYRLGDSGDYSSTIPTATNAGSYTLYYYVAESANYNATTPASISVTINEAVTPSHDYSNDYLTILSLEDNNTIGWKNGGGSSSSLTISISTDDGTTWIGKTSSTSGTTLATLNSGDKLLIKSYLYNSLSEYNYKYFTSTGNFNVEGNIMSIISNDNFIGTTTITYAYTFTRLFNNCNKLVSAENLILPATTLANSCYADMFNGCTSLTTAPKILPATTLAESCYHEMFYQCTSLTTAPELPATTLANYCYNEMFYQCTSLTTAPELPATTLANACYDSMFNGCTSLTTAPEVLPATTLAQGCYRDMFKGCTSLTTAPELPATTLADYCYLDMFNGCTSLTTAPELPATTLTEGCYDAMFYGCTSLNYIKCLATNISASTCTYNWVHHVAASGIFVKTTSMSSWTTEDNGIPSGWVQINNGESPITWNNNEAYMVNSSDQPTLFNPLNLSVIYSSSDTNVATIDNSGNVTFTSVGTVTLTAVFAGNETYQAKTTTCTFNVVIPITLCTLYDSSNNILAQIEGPSTILEQSLVSSYQSSTYKVIISSDCTSIGADVFRYFNNLRSITISSNVSTIGNNVFKSCSSLKEIICNRITAPSLGNNEVFAFVARGGVLITPSGSSGYNTWMSASYYYLGYYQWYNAEGTFGDTEPTLEWSSSSYTITSSYFSTPTLSKQSGITVTYRSSNTSVATINSSGTVSYGSNGTTYIQAIFAGDSTYKPKVVTYTLTVNIYSGGSSGGGGGGE